MKHRKHILTTCVLLVLFVCVSAAPVYADGPPEPQTIGIGGKIFFGEGTRGGVTLRYWSESKFGFEAGVIHGNYLTSIPISGLYTLTHINTDSMYIRPYIGGGISIDRVSFPGYSDSTVGGQGFGGVEFTPRNSPKFSFGGNLGVYNIGSWGGFRHTDFMLGLHAHYYIR
jgi:hypothetical protein